MARQYLEPLHRIWDGWEAAFDLGCREGDLSYTEYCTANPNLLRVVAGQALQHIPPLKPRYGDFVACEMASFQSSLCAALAMPSAREAWSQVETAAGKAPTVPFLVNWAHGSASFLALHLGDYERALDHALRAEAHWAASAAIPSLIAMGFALCVSAARLPDKAAGERALLDFHGSRLEKWAAFTPQNFLHMKLLVDAWQARNESRHLAAEELFEAAVADARRNGFQNDEALGLRMAGEYFLERNLLGAAAGYLQQACDAYLRWGALACADVLREKYPAIFSNGTAPRAEDSKSLSQTSSSISALTVDGPIHRQLDLAALLGATQALSSELALGALIGRMLRLLAENAAAERAVLAVFRDGSLRIEAQLRVNPERLETSLDEPLPDSCRLPATLIEYVARTAEPLTLGQAAVDTRFAEDPYLRAHRPASVLAVPLLHQGRLLGVMYLEHTGAANAFPAERVELVRLLAAQAATAFENAQLYSQVQAAAQELQRINQGMEAQVAARTADLQKALKELWSEMDLAHKIQTVLLPNDLQLPGYEIAAAMCPADQVGGDYYDVFRRGSQDWVLIGDVSGHGVPAGLCMMMIQTALRTAAEVLESTRQSLTPSRLLGLVNKAVEPNLKLIGRGQYMTLTAICIEGATLRYAGLHQDLLVYRAAHGELGNASLAQRFASLCQQGLPGAPLIASLLESLKPALVVDDVTLVTLQRLPALPSA